MKSQGIEPDACTHGVYVKAVAEGQEPKRLSEPPLTLSDLAPNGLALNLRFESVVFLPSDSCPQCEQILDIDGIMSGWDKSYTNYTTKCPCGSNFTPRFHVIIDLAEYSEAAEVAQERMDSSLEVEFLSPPVLRKELENLVYGEGADFMLARDFCDKHKVVFWNLVLFFQVMKLPTYFLDPNFDVADLEEIVREYTERPSSASSRDRSGYASPRRRAPSVSAHSEDVGSDAGSNASGHSTYSHTGIVDSKLSVLMDGKPRTSSKRSTSGSDALSSRTPSTASAIKKVFSTLVEEFKQENKRKGMEMNLHPQSREGDET